MEDSWGYIWEKAHELLSDAFLLDGSLAERLQKVRADRLLYLLGKTPPDEETKKQFEEMKARWLDDVEPEMDELEVADFGRDLLSLIWKIDQKYIEEKSKTS